MELTGIRMQIGEVLRANDIEFGELSPGQLGRIYIKVIKIFSGIPDPRSKSKVIYSIDQLVVMMYLATLCGSEACTEYSAFWTSYSKLYRKIFGLDTVPSHDTFRRVLGLIDSESLNSLIVESVEKCDRALRKAMRVPAPKTRHLCVDGKVENGTGRENTMNGRLKDLQMLNFFDCGNEMCIYSEVIDEKTNEIPHAQNILGLMSLLNTVVSADALHAQARTAEVIVGRGGDYMFGLKGNQKTLYETTKCIFSTERLEKLRGTDAYCRTSEIARNQLEEREYYLYLLTPSLKKTVFVEWKKANAVICYKKHTVNNNTGKESYETRYYLTSLKNVVDSALVIRGHWGVENKLHWNLDTVFHEDLLTLTDRTAVRNRSILNKMCLALYARLQELDGKHKLSKKCMRKCFGWDFTDMMQKALIMLDPKALVKCLTITPKEKK